MTSHFKTTYGFERQDVTLSNWRAAPFSRWSFQHVSEIVPTSPIRCASETPETALAGAAMLDAVIDTGLAEARTARAFLDFAHTDAFVLMKRGEVVAEYYPPHSHENRPHIVFSVSKSLTAIVSGILEAQGVIDPEKLVSHYLPETKGSAYGDCRYRDVLDMRVSLDFDEAYLNKDGAYARYRRSTLWNPPEPDTRAESMAEFIYSLPKADRPHGGPFFYASPNSDLLGLVLERVTGKRFSTLMSDLLWAPLGAKNHALVSVDAQGSARAAGGICVTARDLARVGEMLRNGGTVDGRQIVPDGWLTDMLTAGDHDAWLAGEPNMMPKGRYRSQWYQSGEDDGAFCAIGIHGQWLYVDPTHETVIVKLSSQPNPLDDELKQDNLAFFRTVSRLAA
ncbi:serine hydrolase [Rhizobium sp. CG5]|uniref:serine hydrolase domain-containing protein n=1 Tax=Rhizobium sp. CG5 TaxID=2726076 RepID=UPI00203428E9|nr:serine hydrolase [Rhizobium sp. CG5]MCM2475122.1 serine hydrolase [Rhizobium sp. CG5]